MICQRSCLIKHGLCQLSSMHRQNYRSGSVSQNTQAYINAMKHPAVKILGHCDDTHFPVDYETLAKTALQENVIFEINEASLAPYGYRGNTRLNTARILYYCRKYNIPIILSSDSHGKEHNRRFYIFCRVCSSGNVSGSAYPQ